MQILYAMSGGDAVHDTFSDVYDEGLQKQFVLLSFMILFFTAITNIAYAMIQDGYDKCRVGKKLQSEEEAPELNPEEMKKLFSVPLDENRQDPKEAAPEIYEMLEAPEFTASEKSNIF